MWWLVLDCKLRRICIVVSSAETVGLFTVGSFFISLSFNYIIRRLSLDSHEDNIQIQPDMHSVMFTKSLNSLRMHGSSLPLK
ncbi:hypothetical protein OPV22_010999 [Ensete ventricosum]|uniref:Uncharacterized protein n=1 Tax=Ensete ventricosum TaxID=4639 RepID=A0AAV8RMH6_ENSVE|nr:hypothetical protein OPV22_010999 [Ensete ventricosum]